MIDEGIPVALEFFEDELVASFFEFVGRIGEVPLEKGVEVAHLGAIEVAGNEGEVGGVAVGSVVTNGHVKKGARNIAHDCRGWLEGVRVEGPKLGKARWGGDIEEEGGTVGIDLVV